MATKYIRNSNGGVHSVDEDFLEDRIKETAAGFVGPSYAGPKYMPHGWEEISEDEARKQNPQLFGAHDKSVVFTPEELKNRVQHAKLTAELYGYDPATGTAPAAPAAPEA